MKALNETFQIDNLYRCKIFMTVPNFERRVKTDPHPPPLVFDPNHLFKEDGNSSTDDGISA